MQELTKVVGRFVLDLHKLCGCPSPPQTYRNRRRMMLFFPPSLRHLSQTFPSEIAKRIGRTLCARIACGKSLNAPVRNARSGGRIATERLSGARRNVEKVVRFVVKSMAPEDISPPSTDRCRSRINGLHLCTERFYSHCTRSKVGLRGPIPPSQGANPPPSEGSVPLPRGEVAGGGGG